MNFTPLEFKETGKEDKNIPRDNSPQNIDKKSNVIENSKENESQCPFEEENKNNINNVQIKEKTKSKETKDKESLYCNSVNENLLINSLENLGQITPELEKSEEEEQTPTPEKTEEVINVARRYTAKNISEGKEYFKKQFLQTKELKKETKRKNLIKMKSKDSNNSAFTMIIPRKNFQTINFSTRIRKNDILNTINEEDEQMTKYSRNSFGMYQESIEIDNESIKNQTLFLKKVEKAIFSFNLKKYDDSYQILLKNDIIKSLEEYGEFLLVISGFDKYILGEFLTKRKPPNENGRILKSFMNCCDFRNSSFLDAFRFILSKLNLPKDTNLILEIIDEFSKVYFKDNQNSKVFKDTNAIYLLASSVLALNTMFTRTDIKNIVILKREEFIAMNNEVSSKEVGNIYDQIKANKIDMKHDFNEIIYQRLSNLISEKANCANSFLDSTILTKNEKMSFIISDNVKTFGDGEFELLTKGQNFYKIAINSKPKLKKVYLSKDRQNIFWEGLSVFQAFSSSRFIPVKDITDITIGRDSSPVLQNLNILLEEDNNYLTIHTSQRTIDLKSENEEIIFKWYKALKGLIHKAEKEMEEFLERKKRKKSALLKKILKSVWKREILYNWGMYREYIHSFGKYFEEPKEDVNIKVIIDKINENKSQLRSSKVQTKQLTKAEFLYLYGQGIPKIYRKKIWFIIIGNGCGIGENLFSSLLMNNNIDINLDEIDEKVSQGHKIKLDEQLNNFNTQTIIDIIKEKNRLIQECLDNELNISEVMSNCFKIVSAFLSYRPDIMYNKSIVYIAMILLLNGDDCYSCFVLLCNLICNTTLLNYYLKDQDYIQSCLSFFDNLLQLKLPKIYKYLQKFEITPSLYFVKWYETLFIKMFKYKTVLKIIDDFIIRGESVIFRVAISIFKIQQDDLLNLSISDILNRLKQIPEKFNEVDILNIISPKDFMEDYKQWKKQSQIADEKCLLFKFYLDESSH